MKVNRSWIESNFKKFNAKYFNDELPTPTFQTCNTYRMLGQCGAKNWRAEHPNFVIKISNYFDRSEHDFQNTLLHEMIHLHFQNNKDWNEGHGKKFQQMARSFDKYGWDIHTTTPNVCGKTASGTITKRMVMTFEEPRNGKIWVCCISSDKDKVNRFKKSIADSKIYSNAKLYTTTSDKFGTLKISHSRLGGRTMSYEIFNKEWLPLMVEYPTFHN